MKPTLDVFFFFQVLFQSVHPPQFRSAPGAESFIFSSYDRICYIVIVSPLHITGIPGSSDYSRIWKLPVNFVSAPVQCQSASHGLWLYTVNWGSKAAAVILPGYCTPHNLPFMLLKIILWPDKKQGCKVKVQAEKISASHLSSQPVMMTGWLVSGIVYARQCTMFYL